MAKPNDPNSGERGGFLRRLFGIKPTAEPASPPPAPPTTSPAPGSTRYTLADFVMPDLFADGRLTALGRAEFGQHFRAALRDGGIVIDFNRLVKTLEAVIALVEAEASAQGVAALPQILAPDNLIALTRQAMGAPAPRAAHPPADPEQTTASPRRPGDSTPGSGPRQR